MKPLGVKPVLVGQTHMTADRAGMQRLGIDPESEIGVHHCEAGFALFERDDGIFPDRIIKAQPRYNDYLRESAYEVEIRCIGSPKKSKPKMAQGLAFTMTLLTYRLS